MLEWLPAICLFLLLSAIYLGGTRMDVSGGGGGRQVLGLIITFALYLIVWKVLHIGTASMGPVVGQLVPLVVAILLIPVLSRIGFRIVGAKLVKGAHAH
jgi:hypothetical protein